MILNSHRWSVCIVFVVIALLAFCGAGCSSPSRYSGRLYFPEGQSLVEWNLGSNKKTVILQLQESRNGCILDRAHYDISKDNKYIAFIETTFAYNAKHDKLPPTLRLIVMDKSSHRTTFKKVLTGSVVFPVTFSPDSKMLALICDSSDNGTPKLEVLRLSDGKTVLSSIPAYNGSASWSPCGSLVAYSDTWVRPIVIRLSDKKRDVLPGRGSPIWSPNGKFVAIDETLWLVREKKTVDLKLPDRAIVTGWTPDSRYLLYTKEDPLMRYPLYTYDVTSNKTFKVMDNNGGDDTCPTIWRP